MFRVIKAISSEHLPMRDTAHALNMIPDTQETAGGSGAREVTS